MRKYFLFIGDGHPVEHVRTNIEISLGKDTSMRVARVQNGVNFKWAIRKSMIYTAHCLLGRTHISVMILTLRSLKFIYVMFKILLNTSQ